MESINILTSQNVEIKVNVASLGERILSGLIDLVILVSYVIVCILIGVRLEDLPYNIRISLSVFAAFPFLFYHLACEIFLGGQSLGKKIMKIKVVRLDGGQATTGNYLLRWVFRLIENPVFAYAVIPIITIAINGKGQRLGDIAAGTAVISLKNRMKLSDTILQDIPAGYVSHYPEVSRLSDKDINTINEVLRAYRKNRGSTEIWSILLKTKDAVENKLNIKANTDSEEFLETVISDYNYSNLGK